MLGNSADLPETNMDDILLTEVHDGDAAHGPRRLRRDPRCGDVARRGAVWLTRAACRDAPQSV
jgi:hypothetical protein